MSAEYCNAVLLLNIIRPPKIVCEFLYLSNQVTAAIVKFIVGIIITILELAGVILLIYDNYFFKNLQAKHKNLGPLTTLSHPLFILLPMIFITSSLESVIKAEKTIGAKRHKNNNKKLRKFRDLKTTRQVQLLPLH